MCRSYDLELRRGGVRYMRVQCVSYGMCELQCVKFVAVFVLCKYDLETFFTA